MVGLRKGSEMQVLISFDGRLTGFFGPWYPSGIGRFLLALPIISMAGNDKKLSICELLMTVNPHVIVQVSECRWINWAELPTMYVRFVPREIRIFSFQQRTLSITPEPSRHHHNPKLLATLYKRALYLPKPSKYSTVSEGHLSDLSNYPLCSFL